MQQTSFWFALFQSRIPGLPRLTTAWLYFLARWGNFGAAEILARLATAGDQSELAKSILRSLPTLQRQRAVDAVWKVWSESRHSGLEQVVCELPSTASEPHDLMVLSALKIGRTNEILPISKEDIASLIKACDDRDEQISDSAVSLLANQRKVDHIRMICSSWAQYRSKKLGRAIKRGKLLPEDPPETRLLVALKFQHTEVLADLDAHLVRPLIDMLTDTDSEIGSAAAYSATLLRNQAAIDVFCTAWAETRASDLENILLAAGYIARKPAKIRFLTALANNRIDLVRKSKPQFVRDLLDCLTDPDAKIAENARTALTDMENQESVDALFRIAIEEGHPQAISCAFESSRISSRGEDLAMLLFLTGRWEQYEQVDFDQRLMQAAFSTASPGLRQQIVQAIQAAGRPAYLPIMAGQDMTSKASDLSPDESSLLIRVLADHQEWERLWQLVFQVRVRDVVRIVKILKFNGWTPPGAPEHSLFIQLARQSDWELETDPINLQVMLPPAIQRSVLRVHGRVNDLAFSPVKPILAIGTGSGKIVLWNYQKGEVERILYGFQHSIGHVAYLPDGSLLCAQRSKVDQACGIFIWKNEEFTRIGRHAGSVTALEVVGANHVLSTGRDGRTVVWEVRQGKEFSALTLDAWARCAAVNMDGSTCAVMREDIAFFQLPQLVKGELNGAILPPRAYRGMIRCAAFSPSGQELVTGQYNGRVVIYRNLAERKRITVSQFLQCSGPVARIQFLDSRSTLLVTDASGETRFFHWPELQFIKSAYADGGHLTSMHVSRDETIMALGTDESRFTLWDLRVQEIPFLLNQPVGKASPGQLGTIQALLSDGQDLPDTVRNGMKMIASLLQYRFRNDIQVGELPIISAGEFDILLG